MVSTRSQKKLSTVRTGRVNKTLSTPRRGRKTKPAIPTPKQVENAINGVKNNAATPVQMNNLVRQLEANNKILANELKNAVPLNKPANLANLGKLRLNIAKRLGNFEPNRNVRIAVLKRVDKKIAELRSILNKAQSGNTWLRRRADAARRRKTANSTFRIGKKLCMLHTKKQLMNFANTTNKTLTKAELCKIIKEKNAAPTAPVVTPKIYNKARTCKTMNLKELKNIAGNRANNVQGRLTKRKLCEIINAKNNANNRGGKHIRFM